MPEYTRYCDSCGLEEDRMERMSDTEGKDCPKCGGVMFRRMALVQRPQGGDTPVHHRKGR